MEEYIKEMVIEKLKVSTQKKVGKDIIDSLKTDTYLESVTNSMVIKLTSHIKAHNLVDEKIEVSHSFEKPASWWQHFKKSLGLNYETEIEKQTTVVNLKEYLTFPKSNLGKFKKQKEQYLFTDKLGDEVYINQKAFKESKEVR